MVARFSDGKAAMNVSVELDKDGNDYVLFFIEDLGDFQTCMSANIRTDDWHKMVAFINSELNNTEP